MVLKYLDDQSWLDWFLLILPILVPLGITTYFVLVGTPSPNAHAHPSQSHEEKGMMHERAEPDPDEAQETHQYTRSQRPIDSTRMRYVRSKLQNAPSYRTQDRVCELEEEAENLAQGIGELLGIQELDFGEKDEVTRWRHLMSGLREEIERLIGDTNTDADEAERGGEEYEHLDRGGLGGMNEEWKRVGNGFEYQRYVRGEDAYGTEDRDYHAGVASGRDDAQERTGHGSRLSEVEVLLEVLPNANQGLQGALELLDATHSCSDTAVPFLPRPASTHSSSPLPFVDGVCFQSIPTNPRYPTLGVISENDLPRCARECRWFTRGVQCQHVSPAWSAPTPQSHNQRGDLAEVPTPNVIMHVRGFREPNQKSSEVAAARRRFSEEDGGVVLPPGSWTYSPEPRRSAGEGDEHTSTGEEYRQATSRLSSSASSHPKDHDADFLEHKDVHEEPWYPDGFTLPDAEDEVELAAYGRGLCGSFMKSESGIDNSSQCYLQSGLRGGQGSDPDRRGTLRD